ncbi:MAG: MFS transporter [Actinobacteria bacterium]|nr:MFS transporter [Actinomycetota bacterium]
MVILDATVVNVALPSIQNDLDMSPSELQWVVNSYTLIFGGFLLLGGRAGDLIGRKRLFLAGIVVFTVASLLNGLATSSEFLILARGLQGLGAALVSPAALSIVTTTFAEGTERTKAMGVWSAIAAGGGAVGLLLGGVLTDLFSWPWIFFVNLPVGIAAFFLSLRYVPESKDEESHQAFDIAGAVTVTAGLIALVYGIVKAEEKGWLSAHTLGFGALALVLLTAFVLIERRSAEPLVRLGIFLQRTIRSANLVMLLVASGLFAMFYFNSLYLQRVLEYSPIEAGLAFVPFTLGIVIGAGLSQFLVRAIGLRSVGIAGMVLGTIGMLLFLRLDLGGDYLTDLLPGIMLISIGMGMTFVPVTLIATSGISPGDAGLASGLLNTSQQIGGALGLAILSTLATAETTGALDGLGREPTAAENASALVDGFHIAYIAGAAFLAAGAILLALMLKRSDVEQIDVEEPAALAA